MLVPSAVTLKGIWEEGHQNNFQGVLKQQYVARSVFAEEWRQAQGGVLAC